MGCGSSSNVVKAESLISDQAGAKKASEVVKGTTGGRLEAYSAHLLHKYIPKTSSTKR